MYLWPSVWWSPRSPRAGDGPYMICKLYIYTCVCVSTYVVCVCANVCSMYMYAYMNMHICLCIPTPYGCGGAGVGVVWGWGVTLHTTWGGGRAVNTRHGTICMYIYIFIYLICLFIYSFRDAYIKQICTDAWKTMIKMFEQLYNIILSWVNSANEKDEHRQEKNTMIQKYWQFPFPACCTFSVSTSQVEIPELEEILPRTRSASVVSDCGSDIDRTALHHWHRDVAGRHPQ